VVVAVSGEHQVPQPVSFFLCITLFPLIAIQSFEVYKRFLDL
jgi:hypothetical protein